MKVNWIWNRSGISSLACALIGLTVLAGCDTFDSDIAGPNVKVSEEEIYVLAGGETVIDLKALISANVSGNLTVSSLPAHGALQHIAEGLIRYAPDNNLGKSRDSFEFTIFSAGNTIVKKDTVFINIETDSTDLPCNLYPRPDYASIVNENAGLPIHVLANDILCGSSVKLEVFQSAGTSLPRHGSATVDGTVVIYTPGPTFSGSDTILYRITNTQRPSSVAYGSVYINRDSTCAFSVMDDRYALDTVRYAGPFYLNVFVNDKLCDSLDQYQVRVVANPDNGSVTLSDRGFIYTPRNTQAPVTDAFVYAVRRGTQEKSARVMVTFDASSSPCNFQAYADSVDITAVSTSLIYVNVLNNDQLCDSLRTISISRQPRHGTAFVDQNTQRIGYNRLVMKSDSLQYEICNGVRCSKAVVYIKQQD